MAGKVCHLVTAKSGIPLCKMGTLMEKFHVTCSFTSKAAAGRAVRHLYRHGHHYNIVEGHCPESGLKD